MFKQLVLVVVKVRAGVVQFGIATPPLLLALLSGVRARVSCVVGQSFMKGESTATGCRDLGPSSCIFQCQTYFLLTSFRTVSVQNKA